MGDIFTSTIEGRTKTWTLSIDKDGYGGSVTTLDIERAIKLIYGRPGDREYGEALLPSFMRLRYFDPDGTLFTELSGSGVDETDYTVELTDSDDYIWKGRLRLDTMQRRVSTTTGVDIVDVYAYDGLAELEEQDAITTAVSVHGLIKDALHDKVRAQDIEYFFEYSLTNQVYSGTTFYVNGLRFNTNVWVDSEGQALSSRDQLEEVLDVLGVKCWQRIFNTAGTTDMPRWSASQTWGMGQSVSSGGDAAVTYDTSAGAMNNSNAIGIAAVAITDDDIQEDALYHLLKQIGKVLIRVSMPLATEVNIARDGGFESWTGSVLDYWDDDSDTYAQESVDVDAGTYSAILDNASAPPNPILTQKLLRFNEGFHAGFKLEIRSKQVGVSLGLQYQVEESVAAGGAPISKTETLSAAWTSYSDEDTHVMSATDELVVNLGDQIVVTNNVLVDELKVLLTDGSGSVRTQWDSAVENSGGTDGGIVVERESRFANVRVPSAVIINTSGEQAASFQEGAAGTKYSDIHTLAATNRIEEQDQTTRLFIGTLFGLWPPERAFTYDSQTWRCAAGVELDLVNETTRGTWIEKLKTA